MITPLRLQLVWVISMVAMELTTPLIAADSSSEVAVTTPDGTVHLPTYKVRDVYLPPLLTHTNEGLDWQYVRVAGFEILSSCGDSITNDFASRVSWEQGLVNMTVPTNLQARSVVPTAILLLNERMKDSISKTVANLAKRNSKRESKALTDAAGVSSLYLPDSIPQIRLWDADSTGVDVVLDEKNETAESNGSVNHTGSMGSVGSGTVRSSPGGILSHVVFKPEYLFSILSRRAPSPPAWYIDGMLNFRYRDAGDNFYVTTRSISNGDEVMSRPAFWLSKDITALLKENPGFPRVLLPMKELLTESPPLAFSGGKKVRQSWLAQLPAKAAKAYPDIKREDAAALILLHGAEPGSPWRYEVWKAQAALFVRWAFDDGSYVRRQALWKFVDRASREPATEEMFRDCFGIGFNELDQRLNAYLGEAVNEELELFPASAIEVPVPELRNPTEAEMARILGDWERKEMEFVKTSHQEYTDAYVQQADRTLLGAYRRGNRDPGLLAPSGCMPVRWGTMPQLAIFSKRPFGPEWFARAPTSNLPAFA